MSYNDIYLDLDQLKDEIIALHDRKLKDIDNAMRTASNTVGTLVAIGWSGASKDAFIEKFSDYKKEMKFFCDYMTAFNMQLKIIHSDGRRLIAQGNTIVNKL